ncbi:MAG: hypothetical protein M3Z08_06375 [Chloroflexota bacterium]|nr:hypothetical protein [Chloroflexota bacterium]
MGALEVLEQWVKPITEPLNDFLSETRALATTHQNSVTSFNNLVQDLTEGNASDTFAGDGASSFVELTGEYLTSEVALSGTTGALAGPLAEAGVACSTMVASVGEGVTAAVAAAPEVETLVEVTAVIDVTTAAQGGLDVPEDVVAAGATSLKTLTEDDLKAMIKSGYTYHVRGDTRLAPALCGNHASGPRTYLACPGR